ncbi:GTPase IMAP family member 4 [Hypsizygus marmoreus]|uniref:GTPase IMAP family member 4 n=1 Tax=Hypsizygus marmoreus TaxID=39966 RepID=A0A369J865_HYPMA|nr:GTPase IMAP family member 4 [Hypsizygus marmoreus]
MSQLRIRERGSSKLHKAKPAKTGGSVMEDPRESDLVVVVLGQTGAGKSTFINAVVGKTVASVGHELKSETQEVQHIFLEHPTVSPNHRVVLLDTPGFNDTSMEDTDLVARVSHWLKKYYKTTSNLAGVIYLLEITQAREEERCRKNLEKFAKSCGVEVKNTNIVFATTKWGETVQSIGERREQLLLTDLGGLMKPGSKIHRFGDTIESAMTIVGLVLENCVQSKKVIVTGPEPRKLAISVSDRPVDFSRRRRQSVHAKKRKSWKGPDLRNGDALMADPREGDLVIPIMGPTGVGKSTFINTLVGKTVASVGHGLQSHTAQLQHVVVNYGPNRSRVILLDTPGFDSTFADNSEILRRIAVWLAKSYSDNMRLAGLIYLHEISNIRMFGASRKDLEIFNKLCGKEATKTVVLATTKWGDVARPVGERRERQLKQIHWADMMKLGSTVLRFEDTQESAWAIVNHILESTKRRRNSVDAVQIQLEMVEVEKLLAETEAGRTLRYTLQELLDAQKRIAAQMRKEGGGGGGGNMWRELLLRENENKIRSTLNQIRALNVPLSRRIKAMFGL